MQVNFVHNYSKTFFKGGSRSSETEVVSDKQPLTTGEFRKFAEQQMFYNEATTKALQAIAGILRESATPSININDLKFKKKAAYTLDDKKFSGVATNTLENGDTIEHTYVSGRLKHVSRKGKNSFEKEYVYDRGGLKEVVAETQYGTNTTKYARNNKPGSRVITTEFGVYEGSVEKLTLDGEDIAETSADGFITTCKRRDGSTVVIDKKAEITTFDYSNCSNRDKNDPIKEIIRNPGTYKETLERHWENGAFDCFDKNGKLIETKRMKSDGSSYIIFKRDQYGDLNVNKETFLTKPEEENTQYPEYFAIHPKNVEYDENDNLKTISPVYNRWHDYYGISSLDKVANIIQSYKCPLKKIEFYPSGKLKSEHYIFKTEYRTCFLEIKFNENGQVDDVDAIVKDSWGKAVDKKASSQIKEELIEAGYKGYTECASDFKERAEIAHSLQK